MQQEDVLLTRIVHQVDRVNRLPGEMLDVTRMRSRLFDLHTEESVDLVGLIRRTVETFITQGREIQLHADGQKIVGKYDPDRIEQVLQNLLSNAVKYSLPEKPVQVTVQPNAHEVVVSIKDEGDGISEEDLAHIFERFYRSEQSRQKKVDGLGLGLYIAYEIVQQQGGRMWCESKPGAGNLLLRTPAPA